MTWLVTFNLCVWVMKQVCDCCFEDSESPTEPKCIDLAGVISQAYGDVTGAFPVHMIMNLLL